MFKEYEIVITNPANKKNIIKNNSLLNIKIYTLSEFNKLYYFDYQEETIYYVMKNYHVIYEIAKIYLDNLYFLEDKEYINPKLSFLSSLKKDLISQNLLVIHKSFKSFLKNKNIVIYNLPQTKELLYLATNLRKCNKVTFINSEFPSFTHQIIELPNIEEEVVYVANQICSLISSGISIEKIYLTNLSSEYRKIIKRIFPMFNIPYNLNEEDTIYGTYISNQFFSLYEKDLSSTIENLESFINSPQSEDIFNQIINIINKYTFIENKLYIKDMIEYEFKHTKIKSTYNQLSVKEVDLKDYTFTEEDYVFLLSFNQGIIPIIHKDESYLLDKDKIELPISQTVDLNNLEKNIIKEKISSIKNLFITYKLLSNGEQYIISSINDELDYEIIKENTYNPNYSNIYNKIKLTSLLDEYYKYGSTSSLLYELNNTYSSLPYKMYDHTFNGINSDDLKKYLNNNLYLSYSSIDSYFRCPFSFYIKNILKLNIYEETFYQIVGNIFHSILEKFTKTKLTYDDLWEEEISKIEHKFNNMEKFFLVKLKKELLFIIETIKDQEKFTNLHDELHEQRIYTSISGDMKITFTGIIDKIKYKEYPHYTIIAIIDYKTGNPNLDLNTVPYGIGMQLPVYLYLAKNSNQLTNVKIAGFYLQKILNNEITVDNTHTYEQLKKKNLQLQGYSNEDLSILQEFDTSYQDSNIIKGMKVKKDNSFYNYTKTLSSEKMDKLVEMTEKKILESTKDICNANFSIAPKKIGKVNYGCNLCKFKDLCFRTNDDIVELETITTEKLNKMLEGE